MINANTFIGELKKLEINFFTGVPDSLMSSFSKSLHFDFDDADHIISTNEGSAIAAGMGYYLVIFIVFDAVSKKDSNMNHNAEVIEK